MTFGVDGDVTLIENTKLVSVIRELLSTKEENVEKALLYRTVATGRDVIEKQHTTQEANYGRDALAKVIAVNTRYVHGGLWASTCRAVIFCSVLGDISTAVHTDSHLHESQCYDSRQRLETVEDVMFVGNCRTSTVGRDSYILTFNFSNC